jgi:glycosyltransferase involved in cell wall biosynthesis
MALMLKKRFGVKFIFDVRGLMAEEYVDAGHWRAGSLPHRLTKRMERRILAAADGVVTLTESIWPVIREWEGLHGRAVPHRVVPCCADLEVFRFDAGERARRRAEMSLGDHFVLVYSGSIGGWYLLREMADFFAALSKKRPEAHFLWLTRGAPELVQSAMRERGIDDERYTIKAAESADVPSYLSASDAGIAFYRPGFSKLATSPVKVTEYLACGLPVILNTGIGDSDALITSERAGALVQDFTAEEYAKAAASLLDLVAEAESTRRRLRQTASKYFDLHAVGLRRYAQLYEEVWSLESGV